MRYVICFFFLFCIQFSEKTEGDTPVSETILIEKGDIIEYPLDAEPVEVTAIMNNLHYNCTVMPGDTFEIRSIINYSDGEASILLQKIEGTPGNQEICHIDSFISPLLGTHETIKTKEGFPKIRHKFFLPFVLTPSDLRRIQKRKNQTKIPADTEATFFKKRDTIQYPLDAEPVDIETKMNDLIFSCIVTPGDTFEIRSIINYSDGEAPILLQKIEGTPGDQEICPINIHIKIEIPKCKLVKTKDGIPDGVNCAISPQKLFNKIESNETEVQAVQAEVHAEEEGAIKRFRSWVSSIWHNSEEEEE